MALTGAMRSRADSCAQVAPLDQRVGELEQRQRGFHRHRAGTLGTVQLNRGQDRFRVGGNRSRLHRTHAAYADTAGAQYARRIDRCVRSNWVRSCGHRTVCMMDASGLCGRPPPDERCATDKAAFELPSVSPSERTAPQMRALVQRGPVTTERIRPEPIHAPRSVSRA